MTSVEKETLVRQFLRGESVTDLSAFHAMTRTHVEDVLRESISGLAGLNQVLYKEACALRAEHAAIMAPIPPITETVIPVTDA